MKSNKSKYIKITDHSALHANEPQETSAAQCQGEPIRLATRLESYSLIMYRLRVGPKVWAAGVFLAAMHFVQGFRYLGAFVQLIQVLGGGFSLVAGADGRYVTASLLEPISPNELDFPVPRHLCWFPLAAPICHMGCNSTRVVFQLSSHHECPTFGSQSPVLFLDSPEDSKCSQLCRVLDHPAKAKDLVCRIHVGVVLVRGFRYFGSRRSLW